MTDMLARACDWYAIHGRFLSNTEDIVRGTLLAALDPGDAAAIARRWKPLMFDEADPMHQYRGAQRAMAISDVRGVLETLASIAQGEPTE